MEFLPTLQGEPGVEDVLTERLMPYVSKDTPLPDLGSEIAKLSHSIIDRRLSYNQSDDKAKAVVRRIIHATADFSFAESVRIAPDAIDAGCKALNAGCSIICDVNMVKAGMTSVDNKILCEIKSDDVIAAAKEKGITRAAAAREKLADRLEGSIVAAIGHECYSLLNYCDQDSVYPGLDGQSHYTNRRLSLREGNPGKLLTDIGRAFSALRSVSQLTNREMCGIL